MSINDNDDGKKPRAKKQPTGVYETGYCKPPKANQFKQGQVANAAGRPRKPKFGPEYFRQVTRAVFERQRTITLSGATKKVSNLEALIEYNGSKTSSEALRELQRLRTLIEWVYADDVESDEKQAMYAADAAVLRAEVEAIAQRRQEAANAKADEEALAFLDAGRKRNRLD